MMFFLAKFTVRNNRISAQYWGGEEVGITASIGKAKVFSKKRDVEMEAISTGELEGFLVTIATSE